MKDNQLFTELTSEQGANVSGGMSNDRLLPIPYPLRRYSYTIDNKSGINVNFSFGGQQKTLEAGKTGTYTSYRPSVAVEYDEIIGPGYNVEHKTLKAGETTGFDRNGVMLVLTGGNQVNPNLANLVQA